MSIVEFMFAIIFKPVDVFYYMKSRSNKLKYISVVVLLFTIVVVRVATIFITHFPLASIEPRDASIWLECVRMLVPLLTWVLACYAITTILNGETTLGEIFYSSVYCVLPYIFLSIPLSILSRLLSGEQKNLFIALQYAMWVWIGITIFISVKVLNDYTFNNCIAICALSLVSMLLIWGVLILIFALSSQLFKFMYGFFLELKMLFI